MGMYDGVSLSGIVDTAAGNYKQGQNKSLMNSAADAVGTIARIPGQAYDQANDLVNKYVAQPLGQYVAGPAANAISDTLAERDYADAHGGQYPASPEELAAYKSYQANSGALSLPQEPEAPADQAAAKGAEVQKGVQDAAQNQADAQAKGYKPVPGALQDPAGHLAALNENRQKGVGDASGNMRTELPTPPTQAQQQNMQLNQIGQKAAFDQNAIPEWYKSDSFNYGLISFGLNLLSGNDLATSFGAAGDAFQSMFGQEKRSIWAQDLTKKGYDPVEIENWVRSGDSKVLTSPEERQSKMIAQQLQMQQLDNSMYENSPEMRQYNLNRQQTLDDLKIRQANSQMANDNARVGIARQGLALRQQASQGAGGLPQTYTDTDGTTWEVQRNARGTPIVNTNGMAYVQNTQTGQVAWRNVSDNQRQMGGIQANEGLNTLDQFQDSGLLNYTGNSTLAKLKRRGADELGNNVTSNLQSQIDNINGAMRATLETQLMQENNNRPVQKYMLDTAVKRLGKMDINNGPEENARIMGAYRAVLNSQYHARDETHPSVQNRNYSTPQDRPGVSFDGSGSGVSAGAPRIGQRVNGMTYIGGNPNSPSSWK